MSRGFLSYIFCEMMKKQKNLNVFEEVVLYKSMQVNNVEWKANVTQTILSTLQLYYHSNFGRNFVCHICIVRVHSFSHPYTYKALNVIPKSSKWSSTNSLNLWSKSCVQKIQCQQFFIIINGPKYILGADNYCHAIYSIFQWTKTGFPYEDVWGFVNFIPHLI